MTHASAVYSPHSKHTSLSDVPSFELHPLKLKLNIVIKFERKFSYNWKNILIDLPYNVSGRHSTSEILLYPYAHSTQ